MRTRRQHLLLTATAAAVLAAVAPLRAEACKCVDPGLVVRPSDGRKDVPVSTRVFVAGGLRVLAATDVVLVGPAGPVAADLDQTVGLHAFAFVLVPVAPLQPATAYTVEVEGTTVSAFETSGKVDEEAPAGGAVTKLEPEHSDVCPAAETSCGAWSRLVLAVDEAADETDPKADVLYRILVRSGGAEKAEVAGTVAGGAGLAMGAVGHFDGGECRLAFDLGAGALGKEVCVSVQAEDLTGNTADATSAEVCAVLVSPYCTGAAPPRKGGGPRETFRDGSQPGLEPGGPDGWIPDPSVDGGCSAGRGSRQFAPGLALLGLLLLLAVRPRR